MASWDFKSTPIVIICRDRLAPLRQLLKWLDKAGYTRPILVDNASTYQPLVAFLDRTDIETIRLNKNYGHLAPWVSGEVQTRLESVSPVVVTDCDVVPDDGCPANVVEHLAGILLGHTGIDKVGLGLRIDDLPDSYGLKDEVVAWESRFWEVELAPGIFDAEVDTTFALYRSITIPHSTTRSLRTGSPYVAHHLSWYADSAQATDEQEYYCKHADPSASHWEANNASDNLQRLLKMRSDEIDTRTIIAEIGNPLLDAWSGEPALVDEVLYTPWAAPGWSAWNDMSPELEFCDFAGALMRLLKPKLIIETGVGQGFTTRRLAMHLTEGQRLIAFEDDTDIRSQLKRLPFFASPNCSLGAQPSPTDDDFSHADFTVLDSEVPTRLEELDHWSDAARPGAVLLVHDTGNGHQPETVHHLIRTRIEEQEIDGVFLQNPRGGFLGIKLQPTRARLEQERERGERAEQELEALRTTHAHRLVRLEYGLRRLRSLASMMRLRVGRKTTRSDGSLS
jgi:hypothetical protein